jgi:hypothetical protein
MNTRRQGTTRGRTRMIGLASSGIVEYSYARQRFIALTGVAGSPGAANSVAGPRWRRVAWGGSRDDVGAWGAALFASRELVACRRVHGAWGARLRSDTYRARRRQSAPRWPTDRSRNTLCAHKRMCVSRGHSPARDTHAKSIARQRRNCAALRYCRRRVVSVTCSDNAPEVALPRYRAEVPLYQWTR